MPTIEITDDDAARIEQLRTELAGAHAGPYATVETRDVLAYLLDLADAVEDPERVADPERLAIAMSASLDRHTFPRERLREQLTDRNRKHGNPDDADRMDLYAIAAAYDVTGRSDMAKAELIDAIVDAAAGLYTDPLGPVDVELKIDDIQPTIDPEVDAAGKPVVYGEAETVVDDVTDTDIDEDAASNAGDTADEDAADEDAADEDAANDGGSGQLNAMLNLLETHANKWRDGDGDARYEVDLPDGGVETARTKDDVRALLFKHY